MPNETYISPTYYDSDSLSSWLKMVGMAFDPFAVLEASGDTNLSKYLIEHKEFANIWGNWPNIILGQPGGGKTAMRVKITQACFSSGGKNRPFPINYTLPFLSWGDHIATYDDHLAEIVNIAGLYLLLFLAYRPQRFLALDEKDKKYVIKVLDWILPGSLSTFIEPCRGMANLSYIESKFPPAILPPSQESNNLNEFLTEIENKIVNSSIRPSIIERWESTIDVVIHILRFPSIYVLVDGVDASPNTGNNSKVGLDYLSPLLTKSSIWKENKIFLKFFLPLDIAPHLASSFEELVEDITPLVIEWNLSSLADVIRQRVWVASQGNIGSLQIFASPAISEIELQIAKIVHPLPREILVFTRQLLINHANSSTMKNQIQPSEIEHTLQWYKNDRA